MKTCYRSTSHTTFFKEFGSVGVDASLVECEREVLNHPVLLVQSAIDRGKMMRQTNYSLAPIGWLHSPLKERGEAPNQGHEGAPDAWLEVNASVAEGLEGIAVGDELVVITWLHQAQRDRLKTHPRNDETVPLAGVFATRSPDRPNPLGLHRVTVLSIEGNRLHVGPIEAIDGTPVVDLKPVLLPSADA
jgi:tRNA-Thr(GGU) m(6)t(6)A37 methyltransferase TsaA